VAENHSSAEAEARTSVGATLSTAARCEGMDVSVMRASAVQVMTLRNVGIGLLLEIGYALIADPEQILRQAKTSAK
jgi:hypothetical protein